MRTDLGMSKGKMCVQTGHASILAYIQAFCTNHPNDNLAGDWVGEGQFKAVLKCPEEYIDGPVIITQENQLQMMARKSKDTGLPVVEVYNLGKTQVEPNTLTCIAIGPALCEDVDKITGGLSLL